MLRSYEPSQLFREDTFLRVQHFTDEIEEIQESIDKVEREVASVEKRLRWIRKIVAWRDGHRL